MSDRHPISRGFRGRKRTGLVESAGQRLLELGHEPAAIKTERVGPYASQEPPMPQALGGTGGLS
jgi:hypothetical protein